MRTRLLVLLLAACSHGKSAEPTTPVAKTAPSCDVVGAHMVGALPNKDANADLAKKIQDVFVDSCTKDAWSAEARTCLNDAKDMDAMDHCKPPLTDAQAENVGKQLQVVLDAQPPAQPMPAPAAAAPPAAPAPAAPAKATRGPQKKGKTGDPCEGGQ